MTRYFVYEAATNMPVGVFNSKSIARARLAFKAHIDHARGRGLIPLHEVLNRYEIEEISAPDSAVKHHELMNRRISK